LDLIIKGQAAFTAKCTLYANGKISLTNTPISSRCYLSQNYYR